MLRFANHTLLFAFAVALMLTGCEAESDDGGATCSSFASDLRGCDLLTEGRVNCDQILAGSTPLRNECTFKCATKCDDLSNVMCGTSHSTSTGLEAFESCWDECYNFHCDDGFVFTKDEVCDGYTHCPDGSDENGCPSTVSGAGNDYYDYYDQQSPFMCDWVVSSGSGGGTTGTTCSDLVTKIENCGFLNPDAGDLCADADFSSARERCELSCAIGGTCAELHALTCSNSSNDYGYYYGDPDAGSAYMNSCFESCESHSNLKPGEFACAHGNYSVSNMWVCDGWDDCGDESDESSCAKVECPPLQISAGS